MATASQALSQGSVEQTGAVEELQDTMSSVTDSVRQTAENVQHAREQAEGMGSQLTEGNQKMQEMITAMGEITNSSNEIEKIIKTIEDIAFQTNILALNAAKSAEASQSTSVLIGRSIAAVNQGTQLPMPLVNSWKTWYLALMKS